MIKLKNFFIDKKIKEKYVMKGMLSLIFCTSILCNTTIKAFASENPIGSVFNKPTTVNTEATANKNAKTEVKDKVTDTNIVPFFFDLNKGIGFDNDNTSDEEILKEEQLNNSGHPMPYLYDDLLNMISDNISNASFSSAVNKINTKKVLFKDIFDKEIAEKERIEQEARAEKERKDSIAKSAENIRNNLVNYLLTYKNARGTQLQAIKLHGGDSSNTCVFFASESLRRTNFFIPYWVGNTQDLTSQLENNGWHKVYDMSKIRPGDVAFTMNEQNEKGRPTHTFIFIEWQSENRTAWTIDNQNQRPHIRNMTEQDGQYGPFQYFLTKDPYIQ